MGIFSRKKDNGMNSLIQKLDGIHVVYAVLRDNLTYSEKVIGKDCHINIVGEEIVLMCGINELYRESIESADIWELQSRNGICFNLKDSKTIVAHFSYHRK